MRDKAITLRQQGMKLRDIAETLGVNYSRIQRLVRSVEPRVKECGFCAIIFTTKYSHSKFCSRECKKANMLWKQSFPEYDTYQTYLRANA